MAEKAGRLVVIKVSGLATAMTGEATSTTDDKSYTITAATKQVIDADSPLTVLDGGVATAEPYTVNYLRGTVTFETEDNSRVITITGKYLPMSAAALARSIDRSDNTEKADKSVFGSAYKDYIPTLLYASGSLTHLEIIDSIFRPALLADKPVVIEDLAETGGQPNRTLALLESAQLTAAMDGIQEEVVTWSSKGAWLRLGV